MQVSFDKPTYTIELDCTDERSSTEASTGPCSMLRGNEWRCFALAMCRLGRIKTEPFDVFNSVQLKFNDRTRTILITMAIGETGQMTAKIKLRYDGSR